MCNRNSIEHHSRKQFVPDSYFKKFSSSRVHGSQAEWVTCQFCPDASSEHLLVVGDQDGQFFVVDVRYASAGLCDKLIRKSIRADKSCILELEFVPNKPYLILSLSGHANIYLWDFEKTTRVFAFKGHEESVRALAVSSFNPDIFVTGYRDGMICEWDQRMNNDSLGYCTPNSTIVNAHSSPGLAKLHGKQKQRSNISKTVQSRVGITSLVYLDEYTVVSGSSASFKTDIRLWDMRYKSRNRPLRILEVPKTKNTRDFGVASLCLDRYHSSLFAACTDSSIYEYAVNSSIKVPVAALSGTPKLEFNAFDVRLATSPISDHLLFGSGEAYGLIWDLQERQGRMYRNESDAEYYPYPKYVLGGHQAEVKVVRISSLGQYIVSMDDRHWRLWEPCFNPSNQLSSQSGHEEVEYFQLPEAALDSLKMTQLSVKSDTSSTTARKRKFVSPFVSPTKHWVPNEKFSPATKLLRPLSSITNILNDRVRGLACRKLNFDNENVIRNDEFHDDVKNFFHMKFPTTDLPDFVKERELLKFKEACETPITTLSGKRRVLRGTMEDYIELSKPVSNCSRMVRALERKINLSPRKLVLRQRLQESAKIAAERYTPKTPHREKRNSSKSANEDGVSCEGRRSLNGKKKSTFVRTLEDYFNKRQ